MISAGELVIVDATDAVMVTDPFAFRRRSVAIAVAGVRCAVHFDNDEAAECFARRYADLTVAGSSAQRHTFVMRDAAYGWLFWSPGEPVYQWPHGDLGAHAVAFLADAVALSTFFHARTNGMVSLHAAALGVADGIAAIIGDSNVGKTTTSVACARAGMQLYTDERCLIDRRSLVHAFPRAINIRENGLHLLATDSVAGPDPIGNLLRAHGPGDWNDVRISTLLPAQGALEPRPLRVAFLLAGVEREPRAAVTTPNRAALAAARWAQGAGTGLDKIARLAGIFSKVPCYALHLGAPDATARLIRSLLESHVIELEQSA
jgi:hypothetical protein